MRRLLPRIVVAVPEQGRYQPRRQRYSSPVQRVEQSPKTMLVDDVARLLNVGTHGPSLLLEEVVVALQTVQHFGAKLRTPLYRERPEMKIVC